jgi:hypothetical protein
MKLLLPFHCIGGAFLATCGVLVLTTPPPRDETLGVMLLVNGLCWIALAKAQQWWRDRPAPGAFAEARARATKDPSEL